MVNPLQKYHRVAGTTVKLPSGGRYVTEDVMTTTPDGRVEVMPMGIKDEMIANNPDHLLSGSALKQMLENCCPNIKDASSIPAIDADVILLGIKKATFGEFMDISFSCPACKKLNERRILIDDLFNLVTEIPENNQLRIDDNLILYIKPYTLDQQNKIGLKAFEETIVMKSFLDQALNESERLELFTNSFERMADLNIQILSHSIEKAVTPEGEITDHAILEEFVLNTDSVMIRKIKEKLKEINSYGLPDSIDVVCEDEKCKHEWKASMAYDPSTFFV